jgi:hypothetical protein
MRRWIHRAACMAVSAWALAACGGGGDSEPLRADAGPVKYHSQMYFRENRLLLLMSFEGGLVYGFYQSDFTAVEYPAYAYAGLVVARRAPGEAAGGPVEGVEHSFEEGIARPVRLTLAIDEFGVAQGSLTPLPGGPASPIVAFESDVSTLPTDTSRLNGDFAVQGRSVGGSLKFGARVTEGRLSAVAEGGCAIEASLQPRPLGNLHDVQALLGPGCPLGAGSFAGHAFQAYNTDNVYVFLESSSGGALMLLLSRP